MLMRVYFDELLNNKEPQKGGHERERERERKMDIELQTRKQRGE